MKCSEKIRVYKDKGYSGKNIERPDLQRLMDDIEAGIIKKVVVYNRHGVILHLMQVL